MGATSRPRKWLYLLLCALLASVASAQEPSVPDPDEALVQDDDVPTLPPDEVEQVTEQASRAAAAEIVGEDAALTERLHAIFGALDGLEGLRVDVQAGIIVLTGTAPSRDAAERATTIAGALDGVVLVVDEMDVETSMQPRLQRSWEQALGQLNAAVAYLPLLGVGIAIVALAWLLARLLRDSTFLYRIISERVLLQNLLRQTVYVIVLLGGVMVALRFLDAGALIGTVLGAAGVVGLALGFAFRNIVENYLAGILLAIRQPFSVRDGVNIDGAVGTVVRMTTSETTLLDVDGNHVRLPNAMVFNGKVVNYTRNPLRRFSVAVGVGTAVDLGRAQHLGVETLARMNGVVDDPAPSARVAELADSTVLVELYGWVDQRSADFGKAASEARRLVKAAFDQGGIDMPSPAYVVQLDAPLDAGARATVEAQPAEPDGATVDSGPAPEQIDVSADADVARQVEEEIARSDERNLLDEGEPPEPD